VFKYFALGYNPLTRLGSQLSALLTGATVSSVK
jgi:hypothetical protein